MYGWIDRCYTVILEFSLSSLTLFTGSYSKRKKSLASVLTKINSVSSGKDLKEIKSILMKSR